MDTDPERSRRPLPPPPRPDADAVVAPSAPAARRFVVPVVMGAVWLLTAVGGALCGLVFAAFDGSFVGATVPIGAFLGLVLGVPLAVVIGLVVRTTARTDLTGIDRTLQALGTGLALAVTLPWVVFLSSANRGVVAGWASGAVPKGIVALVGAAAIGGATGYALAWVVHAMVRSPRRPSCLLVLR